MAQDFKGRRELRTQTILTGVDMVSIPKKVHDELDKMDEIKPCFCGVEHHFIQIKCIWKSRREDLMVVECEVCGRFEPFKLSPWQDSLEEAIKVWNKQEHN